MIIRPNYMIFKLLRDVSISSLPRKRQVWPVNTAIGGVAICSPSCLSERNSTTHDDEEIMRLWYISQFFILFHKTKRNLCRLVFFLMKKGRWSFPHRLLCVSVFNGVSTANYRPLPMLARSSRRCFSSSASRSFRSSIRTISFGLGRA